MHQVEKKNIVTKQKNILKKRELHDIITPTVTKRERSKQGTLLQIRKVARKKTDRNENRTSV